MEGLASEGTAQKTARIDATLSESAPHGLEAARKKGEPDDKRGCLIGRTKGGVHPVLPQRQTCPYPAIAATTGLISCQPRRIISMAT
jgi:hypothetical protein